MSFVSRIIPESFRHIGRIVLDDATINVEMGHVEQNGLLHLDMALKVNVSFNSVNTKYNCVFKGHNMIEKASEWLSEKTKGEFNLDVFGLKWLQKTVALNHEDRLEHD